MSWAGTACTGTVATEMGLVVWVGTDVEPVLCIPWRDVTDSVMPTPVHAIALF